MHLTFLGTGPDQGIPRPGHRDPACRDARHGGKSRRTRSAALVVHASRNILLDAGPDIAMQLDRAGTSDIDAVFLTHAHADAAGGLRILDEFLTHYSRHERIPVFTDKTTKKKLTEKFPGLQRLWFFTAENFLPIDFNGLSIHPFPVKHSITPGFPTRGFLFKLEGETKFAYASDVASLPLTTRLFLHGIPYLILDGALYLKKKMAAHLSVELAVDIAAKLGADKLCLTQIGHSYPPHASAEQEVKSFLRDLKPAHPRTIRLAYDGLTLRF